MIGFRCWHDAGKRWKLNDGMDVRLDVAVMGGCSRGGLLGFVHEKRWKWVGQDGV